MTRFVMANPAAAFMQGQQFATQADEMNRQRGYNNMLAEHGAGIAAGDQNALAALAQYDPMAVYGMRRQQAADARADRGEARAEELFNIKIAEYKRSLSAEEAAAQAAAIKRGVFAASATSNDDEWNQVVTEMGIPDLVGKFANKEALLRQYMTAAQILEADGQGKQTAVDAKINRFMTEFGVDRPTATKLADGLIKVHRDPTTEELQMVDTITGQPWRGISTTIEARQPQPVPSPEPEVLPGQVNPDISGAFGVEGVIKRGVNFAADAAGLGQPFETEATAQGDFAVLKEKLVADIANGYKRQPPSWLLKRIDELAPEAGTLAGAESARTKLEALSRSFLEELEALERRAKRKMSPKGREELESQISALSAALTRTESALTMLGGGGDVNRTSSGVSWSVVE